MIATTRILMPVYDGMTMGTLEDPEKREALVKSLLEGLDCDLPEVFPDVIHRVDTNMILDMDPDSNDAIFGLEHPDQIVDIAKTWNQRNLLLSLEYLRKLEALTAKNGFHHMSDYLQSVSSKNGYLLNDKETASLYQFAKSIVAIEGAFVRGSPAYLAYFRYRVAQVTKAFANEWGGRGIRVNAIAPGYIETDQTLPLQQDPKRYQEILDRIAVGRWGKPDDLVGPVLMLCSEAGSYCNGLVMPVDGGYLAR